MAIYEVTSMEVVQRCANCKAENRIPVATLKVGIAFGEQTSPLTIRLPACRACASLEFLFRSPENEPEHPTPGTIGHLHRLLVDELHAELVKNHLAIPELLDQKGHADQKLARPMGKAVRDRWFAAGMKLNRPAGVASPPSQGRVAPQPAPAPTVNVQQAKTADDVGAVSQQGQKPLTGATAADSAKPRGPKQRSKGK